MENINHLRLVFIHLRCRFLWREVRWGDNNPVQMTWMKLFEVQGESVDGHNEVSLKFVYKSYHFSHNHGSVENYPKWKETIILETSHFPRGSHDFGRVRENKYQRLHFTHRIGWKMIRLIDESMIPSFSKIRWRVIPGTPIYLGIRTWEWYKNSMGKGSHYWGVLENPTD